MKSAGLVTAKTSSRSTAGRSTPAPWSNRTWRSGTRSQPRYEGARSKSPPPLSGTIWSMSPVILRTSSARRPSFALMATTNSARLLPLVLSRMLIVLGKASAAAQSWGNDADMQTAGKRKDALSQASALSNVEKWAVNKAVHYNEWANFGKNDFQPVAAAFKTLLACFRCDKCESWVNIMPRGNNPESLRCACTAIHLNLKSKPK